MINLERRKKILELLEKEGQVTTGELESKLGVTGATIRSDLREMDRDGAIVRYHGGAALADPGRLSSPNENFLYDSFHKSPGKLDNSDQWHSYCHGDSTL